MQIAKKHKLQKDKNSNKEIPQSGTFNFRKIGMENIKKKIDAGSQANSSKVKFCKSTSSIGRIFFTVKVWQLKDVENHTKKNSDEKNK